MRGAACLLLAVLAMALPGAALAKAPQPFQLAPWKDDLFKYPAVISSKDDGAHVVVDYNEKRDLDERDVVPEKQTKPEYVDLSVKKVEQDMTLTDGATKLQFIGVGKVQGKAKIVVIYVHGRNGNRFQGANDGMFGGNFNRIKNLMMRNGGVYLSPGLPDLGAPGARQVKALVKQYAGAVAVDQAAVDSAQLQLGYTRVVAPISGRVGLRQVDVGNMVHAADANGLVLITQVDPISVVFSLPQGQLPHVLAAMRQGQPLTVEAWDREEGRRALIRTTDEEGDRDSDIASAAMGGGKVNSKIDRLAAAGSGAGAGGQEEGYSF